MSNFAILRTQKLKSMREISGSLKHGFREQVTPNADKERVGQNQYFGAKNTQEAYQKIKAKIPVEHRKNAVLTVEYLITTSPEAMKKMSAKEQTAYFNDSIKWLREQFGKENVICGGVHRDETTPHLYAYVVPLKDGKLNAKHYIGGSKHRLSEMQTDFYEKVAKKFDLDRGLEKSKAQHKDIKTFYSEINQDKKKLTEIVITEAEITPKTIKKSFFSRTVENPKMVSNRINERLKPVVVENGSLKRENQDLKSKLEKTEKLSKDWRDSHQKLFKEFYEIIKLPEKIKQQLLNFAKSKNQEIEKEKKLEKSKGLEL